MVLSWFVIPFLSEATLIPSGVNDVLIPLAAFCLLQALTRDYRVILKPLVSLRTGRGLTPIFQLKGSFTASESSLSGNHGFTGT